MLIRLGYDIGFNIPQPVAVVAMLNVHPSRAPDLLESDNLKIEPWVKTETYFDRCGNRCTRFLAPQGNLRIWNSTLIHDSAEKDPVNYQARQYPVIDLPVENLIFLMSSRYCEVDRLSNIAAELFINTSAGMGARTSHRGLGPHERSVRVSIRAGDQNSPGCLYRAGWRLPRFPASGHCLLSVHAYPCSLCHGLSGRYRRTDFGSPDGF